MNGASLRLAGFGLLALTTPQMSFSEVQLLNGVPVPDGTLPEVVELRRGEEGFCTGTFISPVHVLTAAHCTFIEPGEEERAAQSNIRQTTPSGERIFHIARSNIHPAAIRECKNVNYPVGKWSEIENCLDIQQDIAIVRVVEESEHYQQISSSPALGRKELLFTGFGLDRLTGEWAKRIGTNSFVDETIGNIRFAVGTAQVLLPFPGAGFGNGKSVSIQPGDSGGSVFDARGKIVAVNSAFRPGDGNQPLNRQPFFVGMFVDTTTPNAKSFITAATAPYSVYESNSQESIDSMPLPLATLFPERKD